LIYIIDQNEGYRKVLKTCLEALSFSNIRIFDACEECHALNEVPDIIILDHITKEYRISGLDFLIGTKAQYPGSHFLFFSSDASVDVAVRSIKWGASDYFVKSKKGLEQLIVRVNMLVKSYKQLRRKEIVYRSAVVSLGMFSLLFCLAVFLYSVL
ncbi:MAG: response regulator, partial [Bacteroidales bacterium]